MTRTWLIPMAWAVCANALAADTCESLRADIEAKIRANGVTQFTVVVADIEAEVAGQVVGTCAQGARKIVYARQDGIAPGAAPPRAVQGGDEPVLTECKDGTVSVGGDCRQ